MMKFDVPIYRWSEIEGKCGGTLILGNGASISISNKLCYSSLREHAEQNGLLSDNVSKLFDFFKTNDFEFILRLIWQSFNVNKALGIEDTLTKQTYSHIRDSLIRTVQNIHPSYDSVSEHLVKISSFMRKFKFVFNLNYDLIVYWAMMYANANSGARSEFKDYFIHGEFDNYLWRDTKHRQGATLVFYPHGNLVLARDKYEKEFKVSPKSSDENLLEHILAQWKNDETIPLFVSEGTFNQKVQAIKSSNYLSCVYDQVLYESVPYYVDDSKINFVIYGWSIGEQDNHILSQLKLSAHRYYRQDIKIAVSVYKNDPKYCSRVKDLLNSKFEDKVEICFFDSTSEGCWNN